MHLCSRVLLNATVFVNQKNLILEITQLHEHPFEVRKERSQKIILSIFTNIAILGTQFHMVPSEHPDFTLHNFINTGALCILFASAADVHFYLKKYAEDGDNTNRRTTIMLENALLVHLAASLFFCASDILCHLGAYRTDLDRYNRSLLNRST